MNYQDDYIIHLNSDYFNELQAAFPNLHFRRLQKNDGLYITYAVNRSFQNDFRIFRETQLKRYFNWTKSHNIAQQQNKLQYFSKHENENDIYKLDAPNNLHTDEKYAIQNIGHATQLILLPSCTILTDPIFGQLCWVIYPEKTRSHPDIDNLPRIDVILISHNHRDHVDKNSLCKILTHHRDRNWPAPIVFVPMGDKKLLQSFGFKQVEEVEWFTKISVTKNGDTINFISIPADHRSGRSGVTDHQIPGLGSDHHRSLVAGWIVNDEKDDIIFKYSGDTRSLSDENQFAVDAVLWNEIKNKKHNIEKGNKDISLPDIVCFEPSGPNYTRCDMDVTHQSGSYSALLKFVEAENIAKLSQRDFAEVVTKIYTVMMHHNKFELGPDRFNEGLFVFKKLILYLGLNQQDLVDELEKQNFKVENELDRQMILMNTRWINRILVYNLPKQTSMYVHSKNFIINEIIEVIKKLNNNDGEKIKQVFVENLKSNTIFLKIGERINQEGLDSWKCDILSIEKYRNKNKEKEN